MIAYGSMTHVLKKIVCQRRM